jgi:TRAP transporter TAXI family solute receptor
MRLVALEGALTMIQPGLVTDGAGLSHVVLFFSDPGSSHGGTMMKKAGGTLAALAILAAVACGGEGGVRFLSIGTAGTGGVYYPLGGAIASRLSVADPTRQYTAEVSGGSVENINRLQSGQMDLAIVMSLSAYQAQNGEGDFPNPVSGLRAVAPLYPNLTHILVPENSPVRSVADFRGLRVSVGTAGSGTEQLSRELLAAYDLTYDDIDTRYLSFSESAAALADGAIDAAIFSVGYPAAAVLEAATMRGIRLLGVEPDVMRRMIAEHPYYTVDVIPIDAYPGVTEDVSIPAVENWIVAMESLDPEVVSTLLNVFQNDRVALEQVHDMAKQIDLDRLADPPIPLHSAAADWFSQR